MRRQQLSGEISKELNMGKISFLIKHTCRETTKSNVIFGNNPKSKINRDYSSPNLEMMFCEVRRI